MILNFILTAFAPFVGGGNFLLGSKLESGQFFSKDYTTMLKGVCCLIVIYVHFGGNQTNELQDAIGSFAYIAVTLFFLISAYGMVLGAESKKDYLNHFWRNRLISLLIPCFCINVVACILNLIKCKIDLGILYHVNGYVMVLLQFCVWFYIVEWCKRKWFATNRLVGDSLLIFGILLSSILLYLLKYQEISASAGWCFERIGLIWGILLYRYYKPFVEWMERHRLIKGILLGLISGLLGLAYLRYKAVWLWGEYLLKIVLGVAIILFLFTVTSNRKIGNTMGLCLGNISYEVYLSHGIVMGFLSTMIPSTESGFFIFLVVIVTLSISWAVHLIDYPIVKSLRAK